MGVFVDILFSHSQRDFVARNQLGGAQLNIAGRTGSGNNGDVFITSPVTLDPQSGASLLDKSKALVASADRVVTDGSKIRAVNTLGTNKGLATIFGQQIDAIKNADTIAGAIQDSGLSGNSRSIQQLNQGLQFTKSLGPADKFLGPVVVAANVAEEASRGYQSGLSQEDINARVAGRTVGSIGELVIGNIAAATTGTVAVAAATFLGVTAAPALLAIGTTAFVGTTLGLSFGGYGTDINNAITDYASDIFGFNQFE